MFHVGQLVCCINDQPPPHDPVRRLVRGTVYTVVGVVCGFGGGDGLLLAEAQLPEEFYGFAAERFRPLSEARLAVFRSMLSPTPKQEVEA